MKPVFVRKSWDFFVAKMPRLACEIDFLRKNPNLEPDLWEIPQFCSKEATAVDVGMNAGVFSRWICKFAKKVEGFECNPNLIPKLKRFLPKNVSIHECALSSSNSTATLRFDPQNSGIGTIENRNKLDKNDGVGAILEIVVPVRRLDDFLLDKTTFIKIDVEGHEMEVLNGAGNIIHRDKPVFLIEIEERHCPGNTTLVPNWMNENEK